MVVRVARESGRPVYEVARESFAMTMYTAWHLQQLHRFELFEHQLAAHDLVALTAFAYHDPKTLDELKDQLLAQYRTDAGVPRLNLEHIAAHQRMVPLPPPPATPANVAGS